MTSNEVKEMCQEMGVYFDQDHPDHISLSKLKTLAPPFMEYVLTDRSVYADGIRYLDIKELSIRIYSDTETSEREELVQKVLEDYDLRWKRSYEWVDDILMWVIIYRTEV